MAKRPARPRMGHATEQTVKNKALYAQFLTCFDGNGTSDLRSPCLQFIHEKAPINASHPVNETTGGTGYARDVLEPIQNALKGLRRQDYMLIGGTYQGSEWVTSTGYYSGHFAEPLFGIPPSGKLAFLRFGEYHKMEAGRIVESYIFLGLAELITAIGLWPLQKSQGYEGTVPGPATQDGIQLHANDPEHSQASGDFVEAMLLELTSEDQAWKPYWHDNMVWYGPGGLGSYATLEGFEAFQVPFEKTFDGWGDGQSEGITGVGSQCKSGDGDYVFLSGWPQLTGVHTGNFLGIEPTGNRVFMRDCDWWRIEDGKIIENWCMLDILHVALQLGRDVIAEIAPEKTASSR